MKITNVAIKYRTSVFVMLFIVVIGGLMSYINLPVESFPDIKQPFVFVAVPYVGVAPADMETLIAQPIEDKLKEISKIKKLTSSSKEGFTSIQAEFEPDIDIDEAVRKVREKVDQAMPELPGDIETPVVQEFNFENIPIMIISITGDQSLVRLKDLAEELQDKLEQISGVLDVNITGGLEREVKVNLSPGRLQYYNLGVEDVINAIRDENRTIPGGSMESQALKWTLRVPGEFQSVEELANIVIKTRDGVPIYLHDLGEVYFGFKDEETYSRLNGKASVTLSIQKRSGENIIRIAEEAKRIIATESVHFPANTQYVVVTDMSEDIRMMVNDLENNIISGLILVVLVLYFFMGGRNGFLVSIAIPLSMLISFVVISMLGYTLNMMVLFSLILALGMLVDNAIVIVENIYRHHEQGKDLINAAADGTAEVGMAVIVSTATTLMAFLPMIFWEGIMGEFMRYLPITLIITLSASLAVGLIFNPTVASRFMRIDDKMVNLPGDRALRWLTPWYERTLRMALGHRGLFLGGVILSFIAMIMVFGRFNHGTEFFPDIAPRQIVVDIEAPVGTRLETSNEIVEEIERRIIETKDLENYVSNIGGGGSNPMDLGMNTGASSHQSQVTIDLYDLFDREQDSWKTIVDVAEMVKGIPGARVDVGKPDDGPPTGKAVEIQIRGEDFKILSGISESIQKIIDNVEGLAKLKDDYEKGKPELSIRIDREKAALFGLTTMQIANTIRTAVNGNEASEYRVGTEEYDITVRFDKNYRQSYSDLLNLTVFHEDVHYPLANFATIEFASGLSNVNHVDGDRVVTITGEAIGRIDAEVLAEVKDRLKDFELPPNYSMTFAGQDEEQAKSMAFLSRALMIALLLIFLLLVSEFNSITLPFVIMFSVVLSLFGVLFGLLVTYKPFGIIMTMIGVISLAGVVVNNAIVLIDYIQKLRERGLSKLDAIIEGGKTRLRPVILTAITTILGLIPLTLGINVDFIGLFSMKTSLGEFVQFGAESSQWWSGMGVVVIFGLLFATALTLVIVPVMYDLLSDLYTDRVTLEAPEERKISKPGSIEDGLSEAPQGA